jgi:peptidoglycan/xylan/chitin deacetylase (PgdA/CDA1 family)
VTDTTTQRWSRRRFMGGAVGVAALGSFAAACGSGADQPASAPTSGAPASPASGTSTSPGSTTTTSGADAELIVSLADVLIRDDYAYFEKLYETGSISIQNHTVTHPLDMPSLSASRQLDEISGQQEKLRKEYGTTPYIFRPPGGNYDATTIHSAGEAGLKGSPWPGFSVVTTVRAVG